MSSVRRWVNSVDPTSGISSGSFYVCYAMCLILPLKLFGNFLAPIAINNRPILIDSLIKVKGILKYPLFHFVNFTDIEMSDSNYSS